ncbi:NAD(P)-dependent dehydrogenase (short-subunit alcohol dehydrogenase family) [Catenuloplanes nepalensis]|uniref:NAD(P)-dependent dehydrogenase (Short-subunit alcohol dehydrogenase family) n=1 Tax=Catenuloplanes nepalensis TaxID=587533 RepID=A0ABT9MWT5_9ACTN|nr:SDR family oxidoreductase [Catenuloplanes nepalensis]MDP9795909.1 NAD(P)-dependent dehydrogenase (short-subunit alcohol dehydrogenase family) [Catenuloplanes nepalensis]
MDIENQVALVTGANRGLGRHFAQQLLERGAAKVYATARRPETVDLAGVQVLPLDVTDPASIEAAAKVATDVTLLVNNAGISSRSDLLTGDPAAIRAELDTNFWGTLDMTKAFAPILGANGGGAILNVLSAMSWFSYEGVNSYAVAKAAAWALTNGVRLELAGQGTRVAGFMLGTADTDFSAWYTAGPKIDPAVVVRAGLDGFEAGQIEILGDEWSAHVKASLARDPREFYAGVA